MRWLEGKHAVITGAGGGIGSAIATLLSVAGARTTLLGRNVLTLEAVAEKLGDPAYVARCDVTRPEEVVATFQDVLRAQGPVHILINNAGEAATEPFLETSLELWNRILAVNVTGAFLCTQAALPSMLQAGWGRVVNVASTAGLRGYPYTSAYVAAKHALVGLTRALALEFAKRNITVNAVCPGFTETRLLHESVVRVALRTGRSEADIRAELARYNPQGRFVTAEEVAHVVLFLCSPKAAAVNGQTITISGGEV